MYNCRMDRHTDKLKGNHESLTHTLRIMLDLLS